MGGGSAESSSRCYQASYINKHRLSLTVWFCCETTEFARVAVSAGGVQPKTLK